MSNGQFEFRAGDIVEWCGQEFELERNDDGLAVDHLFVIKHYRGTQGFTINGCESRYHPGPSLKLIRRPKKWVKKSFEKWFNIFGDKDIGHGYGSKEGADASSCSDVRLGCQKVTFEYEVEE